MLGRTDRPVSEVGLGTWQIGGDWIQVSDAAALDLLTAALESGHYLFRHRR